MSFFELKQTDIISNVYTLEKEYVLSGAVASSTSQLSSAVVVPGYGVGQSRNYFTPTGTPITSSVFELTSSIYYLENILIDAEKIAINRLRTIYARNQFKKPQNYESSSVYNSSIATSQYMNIFNIPQVFYGSHIKPNTVSLFYISGGNKYEMEDDGLGGLYSGSQLLGFVFYSHGIVYTGHEAPKVNTNISLTFKSVYKIPMTMYVCTVPRGALNFSNNPSYTQFLTSSLKYEITTKQPKTYITSIGLYDQDYQLLGIAKVSTPVLCEEDLGMVFRLKLNYP